MLRQFVGIQRIGVIADTHNKLRPEAVAALNNVDLIIHGGDICKPEILEELGLLAPVIAVRGNNDQGEWTAHLPETLDLQIDSLRIHVIHILGDMTIDPAAIGVDMVISGHSHRPLCRRENGVTYLNPGSAGPRRFKLPVTLAVISLEESEPHVSMIPLL